MASRITKGDAPGNGDLEAVTTRLEEYWRIKDPLLRQGFELFPGDPASGETDEQIRLAIGQLTDQRTAGAADTLLTDLELRHLSPTARSRMAASILEYGEAKFRKRGPDGVRPRTRVFEAVAVQLLALHDPEDSDEQDSLDPQDKVPSAVTVSAAQEGHSKLRWILGLAAIVLVGFLALQLFGGSGKSREIETSGEIDVTLYCREALGPDAAARPDPESADGDWVCSEDGGQVQADLDAACASQYGVTFTASRSGSGPVWRCIASLTVDSPDGSCELAPGGFDPSLSNELSPLAASFRASFEDGGGQDSLGCPATLMHRWGIGIIQEIGRQGAATNAGIVSSPGFDPVLLTGSAWSAFDRIKGINGEFVGFPTSPPVAESFVSVPLTAGGALVSEREDTPFFWLPPVVFGYWEILGGPDGCLGFPVTDPYAAGTSFKQDFVAGQISLDPTTGTFETSGETC